MGASLGGGGGARRGRNRGKNRDNFNDINITPFVDVMLVLLIIFMVTAPMMTAGVQVDLPESQAKPLPGQDEPLSVYVKPNGTVLLNTSIITLEELGPKLTAIVGEKRDTRIFVQGDKAVDYGRVMEVMGEINAAGFLKVSLITVPKKAGR